MEMPKKPEFTYQELFPHEHDQTEYRLLTNEFVSTAKFDGTEVVRVDPQAITYLTHQAFRDCSFLLREKHLRQVAAILGDPEASDNDRYVALTMLRYA